MTLTAIVDMIEEDIAVLEIQGETTVDFPIQFLPPHLKEGETLSISIERKEK